MMSRGERVFTSIPEAHLCTYIQIKALEVDISYVGGVTFGISTELWINWPQERMASLPVSVSLSLISFQGRVS